MKISSIFVAFLENMNFKPNLADAGREATEVSRQLKELSHSVQMANLTRKLFEDIEAANDHLEAKRYLEASSLLDCVGKRLDKAQVRHLYLQFVAETNLLK